MKLSVRFALLAGLVVGLAALPALAAQGQQSQSTAQNTQTQQTQQQGQTGAQKGQAPATAPAAPKVNPAEEKDYKALYDVTGDPQKEISEGEAFVKKYPDSRYLGSVYSRLTAAYEATGNVDKMLDAGHKALKIDPNNVDVLSMMANTMPRRYNPNDLNADAQLNEAEEYAKRALALLPDLKKPDNMTDDQFAAAKNMEAASCHSGLGLVYLHQHNIPGAITELEQAVKLDANHDPTNLFLLGFAYAQAGRWNDAVAPLEQCTAAASGISEQCKTVLEEVKKHVTTPPKPKQ